MCAIRDRNCTHLIRFIIYLLVFLALWYLVTIMQHTSIYLMWLGKRRRWLCQARKDKRWNIEMPPLSARCACLLSWLWKFILKQIDESNSRQRYLWDAKSKRLCDTQTLNESRQPQYSASGPLNCAWHWLRPSDVLTWMAGQPGVPGLSGPWRIETFKSHWALHFMLRPLQARK
jgi:hypothetical protein